jgi:3-deoxy-D-manno-octulosonate 8-phosphate phosphatase (KDO 8-P phosphatase)
MIKDDLNFKQLLKKVKAMVFDVDGVLSLPIVNIMDNGELARTTNVKDGFALRMALDAGIKICIITGGYNNAVKERYNRLGITDFYLASRNKILDFNEFLKNHSLAAEDVLYMGDDLPDYKVMSLVGVPVCPADAANEIKAISIYISGNKGGEACVRDVIEQVLRAQEKWNAQTNII